MTTGQREQQAESRQTAPGRPARLSVVIVTYHNTADIARCLRAVEQAASPVAMEVIVVDNASGDATPAVARAASPGARVVERKVNDGFAGGCRVGAAMAVGEWFLFLNPDAVIAPGAIEALLSCTRRHPQAGIVGGRFVHADGSSDPRSWWGRPSLWSALCFALGLTSLLRGSALFDPESPRPWAADPHEERSVPVVTGALMLVTRELWEELDGFDPTFFMYGEDADFCLRAAARGCRPMVTAQAVCEHQGGKSSTSLNKLSMLFTGKVTLVRRHFPRVLRPVGVGLLLAGVGLRAVGTRLVSSASPARQGRPTTSGEDWRALWAARDQWRGGWTGHGPRRIANPLRLG